MKRNYSTLLTALILALAAAVPLVADNKDFHDQDLKNKDFSQASLNGADFTDAILSHANFFNASIKKAIFKDCDLDNAAFRTTDATGADLGGAKGGIEITQQAHFDKANLEGATIILCSDSTFKGANLKSIKMEGYVYGCDFSGANLCGANLRAMVVNKDSNRWKGAIYNDDTAWPDGFDPVAVGAVVAKPDAAKADAAK